MTRGVCWESLRQSVISHVFTLPVSNSDWGGETLLACPGAALQRCGVHPGEERTWRHLSLLGRISGMWEYWQVSDAHKKERGVRIIKQSKYFTRWLDYHWHQFFWWLFQTNNKSNCIVRRVRILWNLVPRLSYSLELVSSVVCIARLKKI